MIKLLNKHLSTETLFLIKVLPMVVILTLVILTHACKNSNNRIDKEIRAVANEVNKNCPKIINSELRLENVVPLSSKTLLYNFTFINKERSS